MADTFEADNPTFDVAAAATPPPFAEPVTPPPEGNTIGGSNWWSDSFGLTLCGKRLSNRAARQIIFGLGGTDCVHGRARVW